MSVICDAWYSDGTPAAPPRRCGGTLRTIGSMPAAVIDPNAYGVIRVALQACDSCGKVYCLEALR